MNQNLVDKVLNQFTSHELLGEGSQKKVFGITHPLYGNCVLKIGELKNDHSFERIKREVAIARSLSAPQFPTLFDFSTFGTNFFYIVEERRSGSTLAEVIDQFSEISKCINLILDLVLGLENLWNKKIVHRDVKPANILVNADSNISILDLGIARVTEETSITQTHAPYGPCTPAYASPEQLINSKISINHRSDQFSVGIIFAQLLQCGVHPFEPKFVGKGSSIPENIYSGNYSLSGLGENTPEQIQALICRLLSHQPFGRFRKSQHLISNLKNLLNND